MACAILRGAQRSGLAHCMAKVEAQSPFDASFGISTATGGSSACGSAPAATAFSYAVLTTAAACWRAVSNRFINSLSV